MSEASSMCMQILKALGRQGRCTGLPEPSLFGFVICAFVTWTSTVFPPYHSGGGTAVVETMRFPTKYMDDRDNIVLKKIGGKNHFLFCGMLRHINTVKFLNSRTPENSCNYPKIGTGWLYPVEQIWRVLDDN